MKLSIGGKYSLWTSGDVPLSLGRASFRTLVRPSLLPSTSHLLHCTHEAGNIHACSAK